MNAPRVSTDLIERIIVTDSVNLLAGAPGVGKTAFLAYLLPRIRDGQPIFGYQPRVVPKIGFIAADRSWQNSTRLWFEAGGYPDLPHYSLQDDPHFRPSELRNKANRINVLSRCLEKLKLPPGSLGIVDPLALFLGGNLTDYDSCLVACSEIRRLCQEQNITLLGTAHTPKIKADKTARYQRLQDNIFGSAALFGYTDTQLYLASPEETGEKHYSFLWAPHHAPTEIFPLGRDSQGLFVPYAESVRHREEHSILDVVPATPEGIGFSEVLLAAEVSKATAHRHLQQLIQDGQVERVGHGRYRRRQLQ